MISKNQDEEVLQVTDLEEKFFNLLTISAVDKIVQLRLALILCDNDFEKALDLINQITESVVSDEKDDITEMVKTIFKRL